MKSKRQKPLRYILSSFLLDSRYLVEMFDFDLLNMFRMKLISIRI